MRGICATVQLHYESGTSPPPSGYLLLLTKHLEECFYMTEVDSNDYTEICFSIFSNDGRNLIYTKIKFLFFFPFQKTSATLKLKELHRNHL